MDDGKREVGVSLGLDAVQFQALDEKLGGIDGAINRLAENVAPVDSSLANEVSLLRNELGMRLTALDQTVMAASENIGKWLAAIALATANPADNSAEVQAHIDQLAKQLKQQTDALGATVDNTKET